MTYARWHKLFNLAIRFPKKYSWFWSSTTATLYEYRGTR